MFNFILPKIDFKIEKWKWNNEYKIYVSSLGHFKNKYKQNIPIKVNSKGYCCILTNYGLKAVHRLVLLTFKPIPNAESLTIDHLNHNKRDNLLSNLEWVSKQVNQTRAQADFIQLEDKKIITEKYKYGNWTFENLDEAIGFVIGNHNMINSKRENIKSRILTAVKKKTNYCGEKWFCIRKEEVI